MPLHARRAGAVCKLATASLVAIACAHAAPPSDTPSPSSSPAVSAPAPASPSAAPTPAQAQAQAQPTVFPEWSLYFYEPGFPKEALDQRLSGTTRVRASVAEDGGFVGVMADTSSGSPILDEAAIRAVGQLRLRRDMPADRRPSTVIIPVNFILDSIVTLPKKTCAEFNTDAAQFVALAPDRAAKDMPVFDMALGVFVAKNKGDFSYIRKIASAPGATLSKCGKSPEKLFLDVFFDALR